MDKYRVIDLKACGSPETFENALNDAAKAGYELVGIYDGMTPVIAVMRLNPVNVEVVID